MPAADLQRFLDGRHHAVRDRVREWLSLEANAPVHDLPMEEHRAQVLAWARELAGRGETVAGYPPSYGGSGDLGGYVSGFETLGFGDLSLLVKVGVQFGLFGGAVIAFRPAEGLDEAVERLSGEGVEFVGGVSEHPWGRIAPFKDPDGNSLQLYEPPQG